MNRFTLSRAARALAPRARMASVMVAVACAGSFASACDVHGVSAPGTLSAIVISPDPKTLAINGTQQFTAVGTDFSGAVLSITPTWAVAASGGAINASGMFTAGTVPGTFTRTVTATSGGITGTATITVTAGPLASITLSPTPDTLTIGGTQQFVAVGKDAAGNIIPITPSWSVVAGGGAVSGAGVFTAGTLAGTFTNTVQATASGIVGTATVVALAGPLATIAVTPNPVTMNANLTQQFTAIGKDAGGNVLAIAPVWSVVAGGGSIASGGLFTAGGTPGAYVNTVKATSGGISGTATVNVTAGALATITVSPAAVSLGINTAQQFTAVGADANGNAVPITPVWAVVAGGGVIDLGSGLFTAGTTIGTFNSTVRASVGGLAGFATVVVTPGAAASVVVTPNPITLQTGTTQQFTAVVKDAGGNVLAATPTWSVAAGGGTIGSGGLFTAGTTLGTFTNTVTASAGGVSGTATVTVTAGPLATITVSPAAVSLGINANQQYTAVGTDANGNVLPITPVWAVVAGGGAIGLSSGLFTAGTTAGTFNSTVRASVGGLAGFATVVVTPGPASSIVVSPNPITMQTGTTQQFTAVVKDAGGNVLAVTPTWSLSAGGGVITGTGLFTAGAAGTYTNTITATSGGVSGFATVTVTTVPPVLTTIVVSPNPAVLLPNGTQQFAAVGRDAGGNLFSITPVWAVVAGGGTIDPNTGVFTAGTTAGTFTNTIRATSGTVAGFATVTITTVVPTLASITVTPNPASLAVNGTQQFSAVGRDGNGNVILFTPVWTATAGGTINAVSGLFTAGAVAGSFANAVHATSGLITGAASVNVTAAPFVPIVSLGTAALNGIMAGTAISCSSLGVINADISISPGKAVTGFPPCTITGVQRLNPDPIAIQNQIDLTAAYNTLAGLPCPPANLISADLGGTTKLPGVYCNATSLGLTGVLTLDGNGDPNATFVFQAGSSLTTAGSVVLIGQAQAKNVFWQVGSSATIGTASHFQGNIIALTSISLLDNATMVGRALARQGAVSLTVGNVITLP